ncbi:ATP-grasp domain-containing protein, partial [Bacillus thuringiensis]|uniref:ATP-grasp domain-containing protein n=2 Tax=Bacillaceae TaxID=186817 RepID=UPI0035DF8747
IRVPSFQKLSNELKDNKYLASKFSDLSFPQVLKPIEGEGSKNTYIIKDIQHFIDIIEYNDIDLDVYELEEFIEGDFYHCDSVVINGEILISEVSKYTYPNLMIMHGKNVGSLILDEEDPVRNKVLEFNSKVLNALNTPDCVTHLELFLTKENELVFIEIAARPAGGGIVPSIRDAIGLDFNKIMYQIQFGDPIEISAFKQRKYAGWIKFPKTDGIVKKINIPSLQSEANIQWLVDINQEVKNTTISYEVAGIINLSSDIKEYVENDMKLLKQFKGVEITSDSIG